MESEGDGSMGRRRRVGGEKFISPRVKLGSHALANWRLPCLTNTAPVVTLLSSALARHQLHSRLHCFYYAFAVLQTA